MNNFIWLFGENLSNSANNNSFYFWRHVVERRDGIDKYFVITNTPNNKKFYKSLKPELKKYVVWRNSFEHLRLYLNADMFFVTLSYRDVRPDQFLWKKLNFSTKTPVIYLQHGTTALKVLGYTGNDYNNNLFRFVYYNSQIKPKLKEINGFKDYQLFYGKHHPREIELIRKNDAYTSNRNQILWFITWREYLGDNAATKMLYLILELVLCDSRLQNFLEEKALNLRVCFHNQFNISNINSIFTKASCSRITWVHASNTDVMDELVASKLLITDYSSIGFDFTVLNKPVILFTPDLEVYMKKRQFYCDIDELKAYSISSPTQLIETIISGNYQINPFFSKRLPEEIDYDYIRTGKHIDRMYEYFSELQKHRITFLGYNFYGIGGTVLATRAMAEGLLEKGYLVQLFSLKKSQKPKNVPNALNMKAIYNSDMRRKSSKLKAILFRSNKWYNYLNYDSNKSNLIPYVGYGLQKLLKNAKSETIISTRESLHPFVYHYTSDNVKNKIYYFHCSPSVFDENFPGLSEELKKIKVEKAVFVTEKNRVAFLEKYNFVPYEQYKIIGNSLDSFRMITQAEISPAEKKAVYRGIYLLRISKDRRSDIDNLLNYGRFLKEHDQSNIVIDVFGTGDMVDDFLKTLINEELTEYIHYCGQTSDPKPEFAAHDVVVDFSMAHSFGMPYIEGILNGKKVFCMRNTGSEEVLEGISNTFFDSYADLTQKILNLPQQTVEELTCNYNRISAKYSRDVIASELLEYINT